MRAVFLGEARVHPLGYLHVELDRTRLDWVSFGDDYADALTLMIDSPSVQAGQNGTQAAS